jgi:hypothetical protein
VESQIDRSREAVAETLDRELSMIRAAIGLVASGGAPRVVLAGLQFAEPLLASSRQIAEGSGVRVVPLWTAEERPADLAIERITP